MRLLTSVLFMSQIIVGPSKMAGPTILLPGVAPVVPLFVQANRNDSTSAVTSISTPAQTTASGDILYGSLGFQEPCISLTGPTNNPNMVDTGADSFKPVNPGSSLGMVIGVVLDTPGIGGTSLPTWTATGGSPSTSVVVACGAITSGQCVGISVSTVGQGYSSIPTLAASGGGFSVEPTAHISAVGIATDVGGSCLMSWYAAGITGTVNNQITAGLTSASGYPYTGISTMEAAHVTTLDTTFSGLSTSSTTVTSSSFSTTTFNSIMLAGMRVEALGQTWTPGSTSACAAATGGTCTVPSNSIVIDTFQASQYGILTTTQSGVTMSVTTTNAGDSGIIGAIFH